MSNVTQFYKLCLNDEQAEVLLAALHIYKDSPRLKINQKWRDIAAVVYEQMSEQYRINNVSRCEQCQHFRPFNDEHKETCCNIRRIFVQWYDNTCSKYEPKTIEQ